MLVDLTNALDFLLLGGLVANVLISFAIAAGWLRTLGEREQRVVASFLCALYTGGVLAVASEHPTLELLSGLVISGVPWLIFFWFVWLWSRP
jgi:hypothetical protein